MTKKHKFIDAKDIIIISLIITFGYFGYQKIFEQKPILNSKRSTTAAEIEAKSAEIKQFTETGKCVNCNLTTPIKANFESSILRNSDLTGAFLLNVNFKNADLRGASFNGANLQNANFIGADLRGADFTNADIRGAKFTYSNHPNTKFDNVKFDSRTSGLDFLTK